MERDRGQSIQEARVAVGARTRRLRVEANLSQQEAARRAGVSVSCLNRFERGVANTPLDIVDRIARGIGVKMLDLFNTGDNLQAQFIELTRKLPPDELKRLEKQVKELAKENQAKGVKQRTARNAARPRKA